ncbi:MAG: hypothetical protein K2X63_09030, partial [Burkholderiaceae bacterium]|nr:hypothetical protein [Burkholderiaceae bacterium]
GLNQGLAETAKTLREGVNDPLVIAGLKSIGDVIGLLAIGLGKVVSVLGSLLIPVFGLLFAGVKDGFTIIFAAITGLTGLVINAVARVIDGYGRIVSFLNKDLGNAIIEAGKKVREAGDGLQGFSGEIVDKFAKGETAVGKFGQALDESGKKAAEASDATEIATQKALSSYNALGLKLQEIGGVQYLVPVNAEFDGLNKKIAELASNSQTTSLQFRESFAKGLESAKTLTDLNEIGNSLNLAAKAGKNIDEALRGTNARFEELFATSLKSVKTIDDFNLLEAQLKQLGANGTVSIKLVDQAVKELNNTFATTRDQAVLVTKQLTELGKANVDVGKAQLNVARADFEVGKSRLDVWKAQNKYAQDGTDLSRAELNLAQANLRLAEAKAAEARLAYSEERAHREVILQTQRDELALIRLKLDPGNEALILAEKAAKAGLEGAQNAYELAKQRSEAQQEITLKVEEEVLKQRLVVEQARAIEEQTRDAAKQAGSYADNVKTASGYVSTAASGALQLAGGLRDAAGAAGSLTSNLQGATQEQLKLAQAIQGVANAQRLVDSAQGNTPGVKSLTDPNQPNNPKNLQDFINNGKNNSNFTDSNGVVFSKNSQGQLGNNQTPTGSTTISAEENRFFDFKKGKIAVPDRKDTDYLLQRFAAARANLQVADALPAGFGGEFRRSAQASYNVIRRALEALGINTQNGGTASVARPNQNASGGFASPARNQPQNTTFNANTLLDRVTPPPIDLSQNAIKSSVPDKTIQVVFTDGTGKQVPLTTSADNEQSLLDLLARAKGVAA